MKNRILTFVAVLIGLSTALITQSFTSSKFVTEWGNDQGTLVDLSQYSGGRDDTQIEPNSYRCDTDPEEICSGTYDGPGTPDDVDDLDNTEPGVFKEND